MERARFVDTVASLRENECLSHGGDAAACAPERDARGRGSASFVALPQPGAPTGDPDACGERGTTARIGDLRYNMLGWVHDPQPGEPARLRPGAADPETGEIDPGERVHLRRRGRELASYARDIVALLNGDLDEESTHERRSNVEEWAASVVAPRASDGTRST